MACTNEFAFTPVLSLKGPAHLGYDDIVRAPQLLLDERKESRLADAGDGHGDIGLCVARQIAQDVESFDLYGWIGVLDESVRRL